MTRHLALVGPTAAGKSALALEVARRAGDVEIVSLDSMQVYRGMDIGTAKPTAADRAAVRHHLVDVADPCEDWSVARTQAWARAAIGPWRLQGHSRHPMSDIVALHQFTMGLPQTFVNRHFESAG